MTDLTDKSRPFACAHDGCDKAFTKKARADICGPALTAQDHLNRHERIHSGERPFSCPHCDKTFARHDVLSRHKKVAHPDLVEPNGTDSGRVRDAAINLLGIGASSGVPAFAVPPPMHQPIAGPSHLSAPALPFPSANTYASHAHGAINAIWPQPIDGTPIVRSPAPGGYDLSSFDFSAGALNADTPWNHSTLLDFSSLWQPPDTLMMLNEIAAEPAKTETPGRSQIEEQIKSGWLTRTSRQCDDIYTLISSSLPAEHHSGPSKHDIDEATSARMQRALSYDGHNELARWPSVPELNELLALYVIVGSDDLTRQLLGTLLAARANAASADILSSPAIGPAPSLHDSRRAPLHRAAERL